ncbi:CidA/LrgA family protein [Palleronia sp. LCG004]|uniref:CidA/LrgA family protein n=1 Tax=Palleronia sp. LCG004 TaxID=3079304 RepID=UPI002943C6A8|nr:CidA/LrgA family protein [Palleronia sp. LCG004]WOI55752.1 CidA/LrgA family protein [Palleronia sp. LCG004]
MIVPIVVLLMLQLAGEVAARGLDLPVPGPVIGLVLLLVALALRPSLEDLLRPVTSTLLGNLSLLFVPAGVGIVGHLDTLRESGVALVGIIIASTILALLAGAWTFAAIARVTGGEDPT